MVDRDSVEGSFPRSVVHDFTESINSIIGHAIGASDRSSRSDTSQNANSNIETSRNQNEAMKKKDVSAKAAEPEKRQPEPRAEADLKKEEERKAEQARMEGEAEMMKELDGNESSDEVVLTENGEAKSSFEIIMYARKVKRIFVISLTFKVCMLIMSACVLGFAAESTPNIDIVDCNYDHRPGFVAFFIVVHAFFFCVMVFLMAYQLFYQLKEKARVPQRIMDLIFLIILIIICSISLACYALWFDDTLDPYHQTCQLKPLPMKDCINVQNCHMFTSMRTMAIGAMFWGGLLVFFLILGGFLLCCVIGKKMMDSPEGQALYRKMQDDSDLSVKDRAINENANSNLEEEQQEYVDRELDYGGEGLALLNFDKLRAAE